MTFNLSLILLTTLFIIPSLSRYKVKQCSPEQFQELVSPLNYPFQTHKVVTKDGYILTMFRMQAKNKKIMNGKPVVLLMHGLISSADDWVVNDENKSLGFVLANKGYDVWLGNNRGNKYSIGHETLDTASKEYWKFSFQDMGEYDIPAFLQYILNKTGKKKLSYVGHSQGTTQLFAALTDPATSSYVNQKIRVFVGLGTAAYMANCQDKIYRFLILKMQLMHLTSNLLQIFSFGDHVCSLINGAEFLKKKLCGVFPSLCELFLSKYENRKRSKIFADHGPSGSSLQALYHYLQLMQRNPINPDFLKYDFGSKENMKVYGQIKPPVYDLSKVSVPVRSFVGREDTKADLPDNIILAKNMKEYGVDYKQFVINNCGHLTFLWGKRPQGMIKQIVKQMRKYKNL